MRSVLPNLAGYSVIGTHGYLGTVVDAETLATEPRGSIVFRGGVSDALLFRVPTARVRSFSERDRTVTLEVDVGDFASRLGRDGTVELHLGR